MAVAAPALWSLFTAKAELLGAAVMRTASQDTAVSLLREAATSFVYTRSVAIQFPRVAAHAIESEPGEAPAAEVVAAGQFAIAETGSVAVNEPADDRARCFLAERLWLLVSEDALVATLDAGLER